VSDTSQLSIGDVLLFLTVSLSLKQKFNEKSLSRVSQYSVVNATEHSASDLMELLQQSAVEHLTTFRQLEARDFASVYQSRHDCRYTDFDAMYAYKRGDYQRCLQCCLHGT